MKEFAKKFREKYTGPENAWKVAVLESGMDYKPTTVDPEKSQALEQRVHQIREVCRIYRVPAHKVNDLERSTNNNIEHQAMEFVTDCLMPWVVKWEAECERKLFLEREKPELEVKLNLDALLRGDTKSRYEAHNLAIQAGFKTPNECRAAEGLPPIEGGDVLRFPLNTAPVGQPAPANAPPADPPAPDKSATRGLIEDAARRVLTKEGKALARAAKKCAGKPAELRAWADAFYAAHAPLVARVLAAPLKAAGATSSPEEYAREHCAASVRAVAATIDAGGSADDLTDEWVDIRPAEIADALLK
jgi:hypothetical protein